MNQSEAEQVYLHHLNRTEMLINSMGDNPQAINAFITSTYSALSEKEPAFIWFSLGTIVSSSVGRNIHVSTQAVIHSSGQMEASKIVLNAFTQGNQAIFKSIVPIYLTYDSIGYDGCKLLANSNFDNPFQNEDTLNALNDYVLLQANQLEIANSLNLPLNDPNVIEKLFSEDKNITLAHSVAMGIALEEQGTVQVIYEDAFVNVLLDPTLGWAGHQLKLDEIQILDKTYHFFDYIDDPANFNQRMAFAEMLLKTIERNIANGALLKHQFDVTNNAEQALWLANPYTTSNVIGETNGAYWGNQADEHDKKIKDSVLAFLNPEQISQEAPIISPIDTNTQDIFSSVFKDEYEVVKIEVDPLAYFLATNPNYEVIAHNITELWDSHVYRRTPIPGGTAFWNPDLPYLKNATYLALYTDGEYHYHQPHGEVRGITFPFMYDKTTGTPLTMPIKDAIGHYDHTSTIDTIYTNPEAFNTPSHVNWYNPYWNYAVHQAKVDALNHYLKSITVDKFMNAITAPFGKSVHYDSSSAKLVTNDILYDKSGNIDFSHLPDLRENVSSYGPMITSMKLANGLLFELNNYGDFVCSNCNSVDVALLENAANVMLHHI